MSDDFRRRRRLPETGSPRRSGGGNGLNPWLITIAAAIVVIAGGWFLGQALAHIFNGPQKTQQVAQAPTGEPAVTALPSPSPAATAQPSPVVSASAEPSQAPAAKPAPTVKPVPTVKPTPQPTPSATPPPVRSAPPAASPTPVPTPAPTATPALRRTPAPQPEGPATRVVRSYIEALRRGDPATASTYLGNGVPDESFITASTRISSISETPNGDGSYKVEVDMMTGQGEYYETFTVASEKILDKTAIKP